MEICREKNGDNVEWAKEPLESYCFTESFAHMIQLFRIMTEKLDFSHPFKVEIEYDPEKARTVERIYMPKEVFERCIEKLKGNPTD
ncbi:MAG: hypothetical protein LUG61_02520 [Lachnospiraceae bacterium]|nr:hypothetical protein [Lachnospiraceae bacterium]